jgi:hypothetical protein
VWILAAMAAASLDAENMITAAMGAVMLAGR